MEGEPVAFVVAATWTAKPGEEGRISDVIRSMTPLSRAEPGNLFYQAQASTDRPGVFLIYEQYTDTAAYEDHKQSPHFKRYVAHHALEYLEAREVQTFYTVDE
jgi:quinol monooxygenase YgiN